LSRWLLAIAIIAIIVASFTCGYYASPLQRTVVSTTTATTFIAKTETVTETITLHKLHMVDQMFRVVEVPATGAKRIIVLQSYWAEVLSVLGGQDCIVGVGSYVKYSYYIPDSVKNCTVVGSLFRGLNYEEVLALKPDLLVTDVGYGKAEEILEKMREYEIATLTLKPRDFKDLLQAIALLGQVINSTEKAEELVQYLQEHYDKLTTWCRSVEYKPRTLMVSASKIIKSEGATATLYVWSPWGLAIEACGGHNIACDYYDKSWVSVDLETIVKLNPEIIIIVGYKSSDLEKAKEIVMEKWSVVEAVKKGKVYTILAGGHEGAYLDWSPRLIVALYQLASMIHGEKFPYGWQALATELQTKYYPWLRG